MNARPRLPLRTFNRQTPRGFQLRGIVGVASKPIMTPRELFTASSAGDLHREALISQVQKVKARDLAEGLQALVKSIGADTGPARHD